MMSAEKPKRVIDRERQWRKLDAGHYTSPKARFEAARVDENGGWLLIDRRAELEPAFFQRWKDARAHVEAIEFADTDARQPVELVEDEIHDEFKHVWRVQLTQGPARLGEIVVRKGGREIETYIDGPLDIGQAEAFATALMLAAHRAAQLDREEA